MCAKKRDIGIFLFSDVMIVACKLMKNRKYRILTTINVDDKLIVVREEYEVAFQNGDISYAVNFSELANGRMWEEYANYCKEALHVNITRDKTDQAVSCSWLIARPDIDNKGNDKEDNDNEDNNNEDTLLFYSNIPPPGSALLL